MANVNAPVGLVPFRHGYGGVVRHARYEIASALASNIYRGSAVIPVNTSKRIDVAAAGNRLIGVFDGVNYSDANGIQFKPYWATGTTLATGTTAYANVYDDPFIEFQVQVSSSSGLIATDIGNFADLVIGTGSTLTGNSADMLDQTTLTSTVATGGQLFIVELADMQGNAYGQYAKAVVQINEHYKRGSTTAGNALTCF